RLDEFLCRRRCPGCPTLAALILAPRRLSRDAAHGAATARARDGNTRSSYLLRPERRSRPPALHPFRPPDDRQGLRCTRRTADRAGTGVPSDRFLRRGAAGHPPGDPGGRGQEFLHALRRGLSSAATRALQDGDELGRRVVERQGISAASPPGRLDAHPAAGPRLFPAKPVGPRERPDALPRAPDLAAPLPGRGDPGHEQTLPEAGGGAARALARGGDEPPLRIARGGKTRDLRSVRQLQLSRQWPVWLCRPLRALLPQAVVEPHDG